MNIAHVPVLFHRPWRALLVLASLPWPLLRVPAQEASPPAKLEPAAEAIARGERLEMIGEYSQALSVYKKALPANEPEVLWRIARTYSDLGEAAPKELQEEQYDRAIEYARKAVQAAPGKADAHAWLAAALGKKALFVDSKKGVELSKEIKEVAEKAIALDPKNFVPYIVMGIWNREIANLGFLERAGAKILYGGLPSASNEDAVRMLERALVLRPDSLKARYELAMTFLQMGEEEKAKKELRKVIDLPKVIALDERVKKKAREVLDRL